MATTSPLVIIDQDLRIAAANPDCADLLGISAAHAVGRPCSAVLGCRRRPQCECPGRLALAGVSPDEPPMPAVPPRSQLQLLVTAQPLFAPGGRVSHVSLTLHEAADPGDAVASLARRLLTLEDAEQGFHEVLQSLQHILGSEMAAVALYDPERRRVQWQYATGSISNQVRGISLRLGQGFAGRIAAQARPLITRNFPYDMTRDPDSYPIFGKESLAAAIGVPLVGRHGLNGVLMVGKRKPHAYCPTDLRLLGAVSESMALAADNLRLFREASTHAAASERRRLAEELHDGLAGHVYAMRYLVSDLSDSVHCGDPEEIETSLDQVCTTMNGFVGEMRRMIAELRGESRPEPRFLDALCDYIAFLSRTSDLEVELSLKVQPDQEITTENTHDILCIVQEAVANVLRHACATHVTVEVAPHEGGACIRICDDGKGFDACDPTPEGHFGLGIMRERAQRAGGRLEVDSAPGQGTVVSLFLPAGGEHGEEG